MKQARNHLAGLAAEDSVLRDYCAKGYRLLERRYRGQSGEIDLVLARGQDVIFVEVKKSRSFDAARLRLGERQIGRIFAAASEFLGRLPKGQLTETRFDLALVNDRGEVAVMENALWP
jgi:putative endonuclease